MEIKYILLNIMHIMHDKCNFDPDKWDIYLSFSFCQNCHLSPVAVSGITFYDLHYRQW